MRLKVITIGLMAAGAMFVSACSANPAAPSTPGGSGTQPAVGGGGGSADRDGCLIGTWKVDVDDMAKQAAAMLPMPGTSGKGTGNITLAFADTMSISYDANIAITTPIGDNDMTIDSTYTGTAVSDDWSATGGALKGTMPTNNVKADLKASVGGQTVPMTSIPFQGALDLDEGNLSYTCSGSLASLKGPGVTWKLTKA